MKKIDVNNKMIRVHNYASEEAEDNELNKFAQYFSWSAAGTDYLL